MEHWLLAGPDTLERFFGQGFHKGSVVKAGGVIEDISRESALKALERATAQCKTKRPYSKGEHSFKLLAEIDAQAVIAASPWAARFVRALQEA